MTVPAEQIIDAELGQALSQRYLSYALSTIMARSLPDVRDGLKPVHRRLLFAMRQLKLDPATGFKKCARVVGDVIGKYHPHGDQSVYDAMVRLAQDFAVRYPLVDGQGNFGNIDGDNAAAMRYTEARLTDVAMTLLDGLDEDAVDFHKTYDGEEEEPDILPAGFPNLLANGATGIAVGMATSIPPHNVSELCDGLLYLIRHPDATTAQLVNRIPGPDFPTGGTIVESRASMEQSYATGRGSFRLRARWEIEDTGRGTYLIVVTEIPYQVQKSKLVEKIADLISDKKLPILQDVRDESTADVRLVLEPRARTVDPAMLMESLYRLTELEVKISLNLNVLDKNRRPRVMSLRDALWAFLEHRIEVLQRRTRHRLGKIEHRLEVLGGYLIGYLNLDEVIRIIREEDEPKVTLMEKFTLTDLQAESILNMRLRALRRLEEMEIRREHDGLMAEKGALEALMGDSGLQWDRVSTELKAIKDKFGTKTALGKRRSDFAEAPIADIIPLEAMIEREPITVVCSEKGWIRALKGHVAAGEDVKYKEGDAGRYAIHAQTTDKLLLFASNGRFYTLGCDKLPGGRGAGEPVRLMIDLGNDEDIVALFVYKPGVKLLLVATDGKGFQIEADKVLAQTRNGKQVMNLDDKARAQYCLTVEGDTIAIIGDNRKLLVFPLADIPEMTRGRGVTLQKYKDGGLADVKLFTKAEGLSWKSGERTRTETDLGLWTGARASAGRLPPQGFPRTNKFT
ncbi:DNA topoisomerase IV subunit A [Govanella unica]|uniref:DNA topoisomerase 4 subunit A n=1 Tax=Govanella unica TaxID=2975056 RepID=A0A9X3TYE9_9PROT|nr:DNA topoisomerase IV subunit A [Govania unica]MDA5194271.1 DNA topoisomerase IV subunit A [Govania unica]